MKKFYTVILSCAVAFGAFAQAPFTAKFDKTDLFGDIKDRITNAGEQPLLKPVDAPALNETSEWPDIAGTYLFHGYYEGKNHKPADGYVSTFEITAPDAEGNVLIKNLFANFFGAPTNDLKATLTKEYAENMEIAMLSIEPMQELITIDGTTYYMLLYGPYASSGAWNIYEKAVEFFVLPGYMSARYSSQGVFLGSQVSGGGWSGTTFIGDSNDGVSVYDSNTTMTADRYTSNDESAPVEYAMYSIYNKEYDVVFTLNFGGSGEVIPWEINATDKKAQAVDARAGSVTLKFPQNTENGYVPAGTYSYYVVNDQDDKHTYANATLSKDPTTENTDINLESVMFYSSRLGWIEKFGNVVVKLPFDVLGDDAGIDDVVVDNTENAPVEYFNLQGVHVENPAAGLYIRRQGNKTAKVIVK